MRTRTTRRRGATPRHRRSARVRRRATVRYQSRGRYQRRQRASAASHGTFRKAAIGVAVVVLAVAGYLIARRGPAAATGANREQNPVAAQLVYTAPTANDAVITLPAAAQNELLRIGLAHESITLTRVDPDGNVSTTDIDLTPRTGSSESDPVLKVNGRAVPVIEAKISAIQKAVNTPATAARGGQALYAGLVKTNFTAAPITIFSSGLDLANPDNFRALRWSVRPQNLVANVRMSDALPALHGPVTFVIVPTAGRQPQLGQAQKNYRDAVWSALLTAAGATSVTFIDASSTTASSRGPSAPTIAVPGLPSTPVPAVPAGHKSVRCTVPASYFVFASSKLVDPAKTKKDLTPCVDAALAAHATFALDGWASYEGPLNSDGKPEFDYAYNRRISEARVQTIASLLIDDLRVPRSAITRMTGHGNVGLPDPDNPRSAANRVVIIIYTIK